ncbi:MAG: DUF58 domain-containing protein [Solirubrobacteraceae bacterium]
MRPAVGTLALGAFLGCVGFLLDAEPLLVAGLGLAILAACCLVWVTVAARGAKVERSVGERRVVEEEPLSVRIVVRSSMAWPGGEVRDPLLPAPAPVRALRRRAVVRIEARFARRGMRRLPSAALLVRDPLGLARREVHGGEDVEVLVLPATFPVLASGASGGERRPGALAALQASAVLTEVDGLRPYRAGAPAARIHWPALARGAGLLERHLRGDADARPLVVLDASATSDEEALDAAVRAAASLCLELARGGGCVILLPGERRPRSVKPDLSAWPAVHVRLALVRPGPAPSLAALGARTGPVFYVAAGALRRPPAHATRSAAGRLVLVVPRPLDGREAAFTVAGCHGYTGRIGAGAAA